jgi:hypothetical protein
MRASDFDLAFGGVDHSAAVGEVTGLKLLRGFVMLGLVLPGLVLPAFAQYAGPAVLSRGEAPAAMTAPTVDFTFSLALMAVYTTGLAGVSAPNAQGQLANLASFGGGATVALSGAHSWKHTHLGLAYSGSFYDYDKAAYFAGMSQGLSFGLSHQFSRHLVFELRENAGIYTQFPPATVSLNSAVPFDPSQSYIPTTDFYDNRTVYSTTQANLTIQQSARLSFDLGGGYFINARRSDALYSASGESATGDAQYRLNRRTTVGATYSYVRYSYTHSEGGADINTATASGSFRLSKSTEFSAFGGASHVNTDFEQTVPIDPAILAILCPPSLVASCPLTAATVISRNTFWSPDFGARFSRSFHRGVAYLAGGESITPGNGLFLTSRALSAAAGYGYSGLRKWNMNVGVTYIRALSLGNIQGSYGQITGSYGVSRRIVGQLNFVSSFNATKYQSPSFSAYNRLIYTASIGIGFSSKDIPLRFF